MSERLESLVAQTLRERATTELALGWLRYKALRKLDPRRFEKLWIQSISCDPTTPFDELVDDLL